MKEPPVTAPETFNGLLDSAQGFLAELARNNTRSWFEPNRARYLSEIRHPAERLTGVVAARLSRRTQRTHAGRVRGLRSPTTVPANAAPYDTRLRFRWTVADGPDPAPGWSCTVAPGAVSVSVSYRATTPGEHARFQTMMDTSGDLLCELLDWVGGSVSDDATTVRPAEQLPTALHTGFTITRTIADDWRNRNDGFLGALEWEIRALMPISRFLADQL